MEASLEYLLKQIEERRMAIIESIGDGAAKDFAQYQNSVGRVQGLLITQTIILDFAKRMEDDNE
jgi:hypothetical protein